MNLQTKDFIADLEKWKKMYTKWMAVQNYSENTIELYSRTIQNFIDYSLQHKDEMCLRNMRSEYFDGFMVYLEQKAKTNNKNRGKKYLSESTKDTYNKAVKGFFNYISNNNDDFYCFDRYFKRLKTRDRAKAKERFKYLEQDEVEKLLKELNKRIRDKNNYLAYRNSILIKIMLFAGLRISEALSIKLRDFSIGDSPKILKISFYGKDGEIQTTYIKKSNIEEELEYIKEFMHFNDESFLIQTKHKTQLDRVTAFSVVNNIYKDAGIKKRGLHILRHTFAMALVFRGENPITIKSILRYSNITTTTAYVEAAGDLIGSTLLK